MARPVPGQSTDAENDRGLPKVTNRSDAVKGSRRSIREVSADLDSLTANLTGDAIIQKLGGSAK